MSMSTHVVGFKPADETWKKMKAVWDACKAAGVTPPDKVLKFFNHETPDANGVEVNLIKEGAALAYVSEGSQGYEVDVKKLPPDVTVIRFYNSW